jgi:hypothetical protein
MNCSISERCYNREVGKACQLKKVGRKNLVFMLENFLQIEIERKIDYM